MVSGGASAYVDTADGVLFPFVRLSAERETMGKSGCDCFDSHKKTGQHQREWILVKDAA